jgi:hypothetical protein
MFAPILAGVARAVIAGIVFSGFKMLVRSLNNREIAESVKPKRITRARARILVEGDRDWSESETGHAHQNGARERSE